MGLLYQCFVKWIQSFMWEVSVYFAFIMRNRHRRFKLATSFTDLTWEYFPHIVSWVWNVPHRLWPWRFFSEHMMLFWKFVESLGGTMSVTEVVQRLVFKGYCIPNSYQSRWVLVWQNTNSLLYTLPPTWTDSFPVLSLQHWAWSLSDCEPK